MSDDPQHDQDLDALGLLCPLPVLKARKRLMALEVGQVLRIQADDPAAQVDVPHFCKEQGHELVDARDEPGGRLLFWVRRGR